MAETRKQQPPPRPAAQPAPTAEEFAQMQSVANAGAAAASEGEQTPEEAGERAREAMRAERDRVGLELSDEHIDAIAERLKEGIIGEFEQRGAFDKPPEPVQAPPQAPPPPSEQQSPSPSAVPPAEPLGPTAPAPRRTFADRYFGR